MTRAGSTEKSSAPPSTGHIPGGCPCAPARWRRSDARLRQDRPDILDREHWQGPSQVSGRGFGGPVSAQFSPLQHARALLPARPVHGS
ncbi:hypothetical protein G6F22_021699 [Rhizopus arrhizus]|nr:hypothetical protein G6F22_021699 [Rhizopus arrhizus]